jgi:hypothetical protein
MLAGVKREIFSVKRLPTLLVVACFQRVTDMLKKWVKMEWISDGPACWTLRPLAGCNEPPVGRGKQHWGLDQLEKVALIDQDVEFLGTVAAVIPVIEIDPKPDAPLAVVNVNCPAIERVGMGQKNHNCGWELNPAKDLGILSELE